MQLSFFVCFSEKIQSVIVNSVSQVFPSSLVLYGTLHMLTEGPVMLPVAVEHIVPPMLYIVVAGSNTFHIHTHTPGLEAELI